MVWSKEEKKRQREGSQTLLRGRGEGDVRHKERGGRRGRAEQRSFVLAAKNGVLIVAVAQWFVARQFAGLACAEVQIASMACMPPSRRGSWQRWRSTGGET